MTHLLFVQGGGEGAHDRWDNRLVDSLRRVLGEDVAIRYPALPNEADPAYAAWSRALLRELAALDDGAILVGHSIGATVLAHTLAREQPAGRFAGLVLIAPPFIGEEGWASDDMTPDLDFTSRLPDDLPVLIVRGDRDDTMPAAHLNAWSRALPSAAILALPGRDHQLNDDLSEVAAEIRLWLTLAQTAVSPER